MGCCYQPHAPAASTPGQDPVPIVQDDAVSTVSKFVHLWVHKVLLKKSTNKYACRCFTHSKPFSLFSWYSVVQYSYNDQIMLTTADSAAHQTGRCPHSVVLIQLYVNLVPLLWPCDNCWGQRPSRPYLNLIQNSGGGLPADIFSRTIPRYRFPTARHCHLALDLKSCTFMQQRITTNILLRSLTIPTVWFKGNQSALFISGSYPEHHTADTTQNVALFPILVPQVSTNKKTKLKNCYFQLTLGLAVSLYPLGLYWSR